MDPLYGLLMVAGVHLADASIFLIFASILTFFDVSAAVVDGKPILPSGKFLDGTIRCAYFPGFQRKLSYV